MTATPALPSTPFPETPERRAALTRDIETATGLNEATLERPVRAFYKAARGDPSLGPLFAHIADWDAHIARICAIWSSVALMSGRYHGQPLAGHLPLDLRPAHFVRRLELFETTAARICSPAGAAHLTARAHRIARSLEVGVAIRQGELPGRLQ